MVLHWSLNRTQCVLTEFNCLVEVAGRAAQIGYGTEEPEADPEILEGGFQVEVIACEACEKFGSRPLLHCHTLFFCKEKLASSAVTVAVIRSKCLMHCKDA